MPKALDAGLEAEARGPDAVTESQYYDEGVLGSAALVLLALLRGFNSHAVHVLLALCGARRATRSPAVTRGHPRS